MRQRLIDLLLALLAWLDDSQPAAYRITQAGRDALRKEKP